MILFGVSVFLSAFLLFLIQPMIGKAILPWFGGTPAVWSTVMLFFQVLLLGGYAYANWLVGHRNKQLRIHLVVVGFAFLILVGMTFVWSSPVIPGSNWKPLNVTAPVLGIFKLLIVSVGLPFFVLASNGPLMQAWFSRLYPDKSYARLYALSNVGSLLGLLCYPIFIEPFLTLKAQGWMWSIGFGAFGLFLIRTVLLTDKSDTQIDPKLMNDSIGESHSWGSMAYWALLSATASMFLLSITNQISQEVAVIPFLWIIPLAIYLLSFILTFSGDRGYNRPVYSVLFVTLLVLTILVMVKATSLHVYWQIPVYSGLLFVACMICHGELYSLRPAAKQLTRFYLMVSLGGALGGLFVSLVSPFIFNGYWELFVAIAMTTAVVLANLRSTRVVARQSQFVFFVFVLVTGMLVIVGQFFSGALFVQRNFYGVIRVREELAGSPPRPAYLMTHGITIHGLQFTGTDRDQPTTYFVKDSGAGIAITNHPKYGKGLRLGMLGLGAGTLTAYGRPGDVYRLYEINPDVISLAEGEGGYFSFVSDSLADVTLVPGDARISLENEFAESGSQNFDILILDTFSSDSIPVHLVTKEAVQLYLDHLAPDGIIAAHITNLHLDLQPVFWKLAQHYGLTMTRINYGGDDNGGFTSHWILLSRDPGLLNIPGINEHALDLTEYSTNISLWTDDYSNLFQILK